MSGGPKFSPADLKFKMPFCAILGGPSSSGKTTWLMRFLGHYKDMLDPIPASVLYAYGEFNSNVPVLERAGFATHPGLPDDELLRQMDKPLLLVLDDLMLSSNVHYLADLFTKKSHHQNISVLYLTQDMFDKNIRVARMNSQYLIMMRAPNAAQNVRSLGAQLFSGRYGYFIDAYEQATIEPYGYLLIDMHASTHPHLRLRTNIFPEENTIVFSPNDVGVTRGGRTARAR